MTRRRLRNAALCALSLFWVAAIVGPDGSLAQQRDPGGKASKPSSSSSGKSITRGPAVDFGDDASQWSNDGECDDPRFVGPGMTATTLLDSDILHDATDCRTAYEAGQLTLREGGTPPPPRSAVAGGVDFGDDSSQWSNDGECDDPRFQGPGMTTTTLLASDILHDATDCRTAYEAGQLTLRDSGAVPQSSISGGIDFGDDSSQWANDGECDDPRFTGPGMTTTTLLASDILHDATDCRTAYEAGQLSLQ